jgi:hypothetical protein
MSIRICKRSSSRAAGSLENIGGLQRENATMTRHVSFDDLHKQMPIMKTLLTIILSTSLVFAGTSIDSITGCGNYEKIISKNYLLTFDPYSTFNCDGWKISIIPKEDKDSNQKRDLSIITLPLRGQNSTAMILFKRNHKLDYGKENIGLEREIWYVKNIKEYQNAEETIRKMDKSKDPYEREKLLEKCRKIKNNKIILTIMNVEDNPIKVVFKISE